MSYIGTAKDPDGHKHVYFVDTPINRELRAKDETALVKDVNNLKCMGALGVAAGIAFFVDTIMLILCSSWQCYNPPDNMTKYTCQQQGYCSLSWQVPVEILAGLILICTSIVVCKCCK